MDIHADEAGQHLSDIHQWMREGRRVMVESWHLQAWWGALSAGALLITWWAVQLQAWRALPLVWPLALLLGWAGSFLIVRLSPLRARNQATRAVGGIWLGAGVTLTFVGLMGSFSGSVPPGALPGFVAAVLGGAYWATSRVTEIRWLGGVAAMWWVGAAVLLTLPMDAGLLLLAAMALLLESGPALILSGEARGGR